jgi:hypothetical protein
LDFEATCTVHVTQSAGKEKRAEKGGRKPFCLSQVNTKNKIKNKSTLFYEGRHMTAVS